MKLLNWIWENVSAILKTSIIIIIVIFGIYGLDSGKLSAENELWLIVGVIILIFSFLDNSHRVR